MPMAIPPSNPGVRYHHGCTSETPSGRWAPQQCTPSPWGGSGPGPAARRWAASPPRPTGAWPSTPQTEGPSQKPKPLRGTSGPLGIPKCDGTSHSDCRNTQARCRPNTVWLKRGPRQDARPSHRTPACAATQPRSHHAAPAAAPPQRHYPPCTPPRSPASPRRCPHPYPRLAPPHHPSGPGQPGPASTRYHAAEQPPQSAYPPRCLARARHTGARGRAGSGCRRSCRRCSTAAACWRSQRGGPRRRTTAGTGRPGAVLEARRATGQ
mmetsp:Transcript_37853/g.99129  ORF Transcript_37853/g.99129 Transcript_37853/m.99129 type:complete len:266 (+) Transcript_37853:234-1031(+)